MIHQQKIGSQVEEQNSVFLSRTAQVLKTKKPEEILLQVRTKKIEELNKYKEAPSEKKFKDIQALLVQMNAHSKLPKAKIPGMEDKQDKQEA